MKSNTHTYHGDQLRSLIAAEGLLSAIEKGKLKHSAVIKKIV